jgi:hypothetical protein
VRNKNISTEEPENHEGMVGSAEEQSEKIRYGAPDGPRPEGSEDYNGHTPIEYPGLEAVAQYLAAPKSLREFKSDNELAKYFDVTRNTIQRWKHHPDVTKRVYSISNRYRMAGDVEVRRNWLQITEKLVEKAMTGDVQAIKLCDEIAWRQEKKLEKLQVSPHSYSIDELIEAGEKEDDEVMLPSWAEERSTGLGSSDGNGQAKKTVEANPEPDPAPPVAANTCDACRQTRCTHGRCPMCESCEVCQ